MFKPTSLLEGKTIDSPEADLRAAKRVEQYRISEKALYIPAGLRWTYLPLSEIESAEESHRCVVAGKCVAVEEKRPSLLLRAGGKEFSFNLEKAASLEILMERIWASRG